MQIRFQILQFQLLLILKLYDCWFLQRKRTNFLHLPVKYFRANCATIRLNLALIDLSRLKENKPNGVDLNSNGLDNFVPKALASLTHGRNESLIKAFVPTREFWDLIGLKLLLGHQGYIRLNHLVNAFAFDSIFVMTELRSSNFPDSSQTCSGSAFMQEKLEFME